MKLIKFPINLILYRLIFSTVVIATLTLIPIALSAYISSIAVLLGCAIAVNSILFTCALFIGVWLNLFEASNVFMMTPTQEQLAHAVQSRKLLEKDLEHARKEFNRLLK